MSQTNSGNEVASGAAGLLASEQDLAERTAKLAVQSAHNFLISEGLYSTISLEGELGEAVEDKLRHGAFAFDSYCIDCKRETTFRVTAVGARSRGQSPNYSLPPSAHAEYLVVTATCARDYTKYSFVVRMTEVSALKVGQYPSPAEIAFGELRTIDKSLSSVDRRELGKALGLSSHDSAIGAFAYLRRVFERMIDRAHERQAERGQGVHGFKDLRMNEKVAALGGELPPMVVRNSGVFSVLSMGLHELSEEQCAKHFAVIKAVLFQMLEHEEHKRKAEITQKETEAALQRILANPGQ